MTEPIGNVFSSSSHRNVSPITTSSLNDAGMASNSIKLLTGNSHPDLAKAVADRSVHGANMPLLLSLPRLGNAMADMMLSLV
jgi:hypothetical protein